MRGATECAKRLKLLFSALRSKLGKVSCPSMSDPITQLILGILSRDTPETKASEGLERLRGMVVDYNELRVIPPIELAEILADFPDARLKCEDISRALNGVFALEHAISLDRLANLSRKEALAILERIDGLEPYTRARVSLLGLRHHAIPLDEAMWAYARAEAVVDPRCPLAEAQRFLERQIPEESGLEFFALFKRQAWAEMGSAVKKREVARILSVPPDRTTRNMLQMIGRYAAADTSLSEADESAEQPEGVGPASGVTTAAVTTARSAGRASRRPTSKVARTAGRPRKPKPAERARSTAKRGGSKKQATRSRGAAKAKSA
jgi:hypothetical protein